MTTAFYDLRMAPSSHDFLIFAFAARERGCTTCVFVPGYQLRTTERYGADGAEQRLTGMLMPLAKCAGMLPIRAKSVTDAERYWHKDCFPEGYTTDHPAACHVFEAVQPRLPMANLVPGESVLETMRWKYGGRIVFTIRDQMFHGKRNSLVQENIRAGQELERRGHRVVFIPDTVNPRANFGGLDSCHDAALDSEQRVALMSVAKVNIGRMSGATAIAWMTRLPLIAMCPLVEHYLESSGRQWRKLGIPAGSRPSFHQPNQLTVWKPDTAANILAAFEQWQAMQVHEECYV